MKENTKGECALQSASLLNKYIKWGLTYEPKVKYLMLQANKLVASVQTPSCSPFVTPDAVRLFLLARGSSSCCLKECFFKALRYQ